MPSLLRELKLVQRSATLILAAAGASIAVEWITSRVALCGLLRHSSADRDGPVSKRAAFTADRKQALRGSWTLVDGHARLVKTSQPADAI